ncbi:gag-pol polyprotein [Tanacetum coccineum]|uniref:Gag-pol polyprotein n=1 Tax=Tanacetum coccineum TaxID=301880 RepID=A0ABQ4YPJ7_9ASTR
MKAILRKDKCLAAIGERPAEVTDDSKWDEMDGNAITNLHLALADGVLSSMEEKKTWQRNILGSTCSICTRQDHSTIELFSEKLYALRMIESTSVIEHVNNLNTLFSQLTSLDFFDDVAAAILEEENRRNNREDRQTSSRQVEALVVTRGRLMEPGSNGSGKYKTRKKKNFKCFKCDKPGHVRKDCWGLNSSHPQGNVGSTLEDGNALCCEVAVANESRKRFANVWLFDTGATFHMTAKREYFHQYKPNSGGGSMYSCNDHEIKIIGIGCIMVKMHDEDLGCKVEIQNKIMKIIKGALVLMRGEKVAANLYQLKGEIIEEAEASVASDSPSHRVAVTLYQKLGHIKHHRLKFKTSNSRSVSVLELVHSDVWQAPNGVAEQMNRTLLERARAMLATASLGKSFWAKAVNTACYVINRSPSTVVELKTPMEMWTEKPVNYSNLHIFAFEVAPWHEVNEINESQAPATRTLNRERRHPGRHSDYVMESNVEYCRGRGINSSRITE